MFVFTKQAEKQLKKLDDRIQQQIKQKLFLLKQDPQLLCQNIKIMINVQPITHRIRVGSHRLLLSFDEKKQVYKVVKVAHRREIYK